MSRFFLIASNVGTAVVTCLVTSIFWIGAYGNAPSPSRSAERRAEQASAAGGTMEFVRGPTGLVIPVVGVKASSLVDTFAQARAGGRRVHDAIDIMAPAGTSVVAAAPGTVEKLFFSQGGGGITVYVRSPDRRWIYYYAHLLDYAAGLREGQKVRQGDLLGRVGSTGNADPAGPHLHFAIQRMEPGQKWHQGRPINPYPLLAGRGPGS